MSFYSGPYLSSANRTSISPKLILQATFLILLVTTFCAKTSFAQIYEQIYTTTILDVSGHSYAWPNPVTLTASVQGDGQPVTSGQVLFCKSGPARCQDLALLGKAQLKSNGTASIKVILPLGKTDIYAMFLDTKTYMHSSSLPAVQTVEVSGKYASAINVSATGTTGNYSLGATVTALGSEVPSGSVSFLDAVNPSRILNTQKLDPAAVTYDYSDTLRYLSGNNLAPSDLAIGDLNNDGVPDLVLVNSNSPSTVSVLFGDASRPGRYLPAKTIATRNSSTVNASTQVITIDDFNNDGFPDIAVGSMSGTSTISVLLNDPSKPGNFLPFAEYPAGPGIIALFSKDCDGDGQLDLIAVTDGDPNASPAVPASITVLRGDLWHPGKFLSPSITNLEGTPNSATAVALMSDNHIYVALTNSRQGHSYLELYYSNFSTPGVFVQYQTFLTYGSASAITAGDFNQDGYMDLATEVFRADPEPHEYLDVYLEDPNHVSQFLGSTEYSLASLNAGTSLMTGDFNGDGWMDLALFAYPGVEVLYADPSTPGLFDRNTRILKSPLNVSDQPFYVQYAHTADLNGDGLLDIASAEIYQTNDKNFDTIGYADVYLAGNTQQVTADHVALGSETPYIEASYSGDASYYGHTSCAIALAVDGQIAPTMSAISVSNVGRNSATLTWTSNIGTNGQVNYGTTTSLGTLTPWVAAPSTQHVVTLSGLSPGTTYYFKAQSVAFFDGCTHWTVFSPAGSLKTLP